MSDAVMQLRGFDAIADAMAEMFELDRTEIAPDSSLFEDLDLDSIDAIDMLKRIEQATGQRVDHDVLKRLRTVDDLVALVDALHTP